MDVHGRALWLANDAGLRANDERRPSRPSQVDGARRTSASVVLRRSSSLPHAAPQLVMRSCYTLTPATLLGSTANLPRRSVMHGSRQVALFIRGNTTQPKSNTCDRPTHWSYICHLHRSVDDSDMQRRNVLLFVVTLRHKN